MESVHFGSPRRFILAAERLGRRPKDLFLRHSHRSVVAVMITWAGPSLPTASIDDPALSNGIARKAARKQYIWRCCYIPRGGKRAISPIETQNQPAAHPGVAITADLQAGESSKRCTAEVLEVQELDVGRTPSGSLLSMRA